MKIDLCKLFGVEEGKEFKIEGYRPIYFIQNGCLYFIDDDDFKRRSCSYINDLVNKEIIKLPKKKVFSDDELCILRNIDKKFKWIARDKRNTLYVYKEDEPYARFPYDDIFKSISCEDKKATYIDDYVDRN